MRAVKLSVKKLVSVFAVLSLTVILPVVGIGVNKAEATECNDTTIDLSNLPGGTCNQPNDLWQYEPLISPTTLDLKRTGLTVTGTMPSGVYLSIPSSDNPFEVTFNNVTISVDHAVIPALSRWNFPTPTTINLVGQNTITNQSGKAFLSNISQNIHFTGSGSLAITGKPAIALEGTGGTITVSDSVTITATNSNGSAPNCSSISSSGSSSITYTGGGQTCTAPNSDSGSPSGGGSSSTGSSNNGSSSYSGPTPFTDEIEGQLANAREFTVLNSDLANFQIDVKDLNLVPSEPIEAFVFSTPTYAGVVTPVDGIATFNIANLNLSAGTHTLAVVQPGTNVVKGKATVKVGNTAEAKIAKTAGNSAATGLIAFALFLTAAFTTAATRRKNNA